MRLASKLTIAACCSASLTACPVDERPLKPYDVSISGGGGVAGLNTAGEAGEGDGGDAASQNGGSSGQGGSQGGIAGTPTLGGTSGASGDSGNGGNAGSAGSRPVGRCPDLDVNDVLDCDETLATNATFDDSVLPWVSESPNVVEDWNEADAHEKTGSGSISIKNSSPGSSGHGVRQCIPVTGGIAYNFAAEAFVPSEVPGAQAGIHVLAHQGDACSGMMVDHQQSNYITTGTGWRVAKFTYLLPANAKSVVVRLLSTKLAGEPTHVFWDNVLVNVD